MDTSLVDEQANNYFFLEKDNALFSERDRWRLVDQIGDTAIFENLHAMPRAWLVSEVISAKENEILKAIHTSVLPDGREYRPDRMALIEESLSIEMKKVNLLDSSVKIVQLTNTNIIMTTQSQDPRFLVLSDIYYPGWLATIDGIATHIFRTNYVLRGVLIPAGEHMVSFQYTPSSFFFGAGISVLTMAFIGVACIINRKR